ncbi:MAG: asparagine synthase (glutamine-hydrolyzing) [Bacillota bacterium]
MCGIAGIVELDPRREVEQARLERMRAVLHHRGPDDAGTIARGRAGFAHSRLSIIDIGGGRQPMQGVQGTWIAYNGEIYNFRELRGELMARGYRFSTQSDTEVILRAYEAYGEDCVRHLRGMFAFAIWEEGPQKLFLARDRLGIKPLYYAVTEEEVLFGSEIKAILAAGGVPPALNTSILSEFLANRYVAGGETFFRNVHKLLPAHTLTWTPANGFRQRSYWSLPDKLHPDSIPFEVHASELRRRLEEAVRSHLMSDVPLGLFLSGGIDSSAIAALMAPMMQGRLQSFAVGFAEQGYNELGYARLMARAVGAEHRDLMVSAGDFLGALPRMVWHEDEPIAFPSSICLYFVSRLAAGHVKVVLTGEGSDELFLGYNRYRVTAWNERLGRPYWAAVPAHLRENISRLVQRLPRRLRRYAERSFLVPPPGPRGLFYENFAVFPEALQRLLLADVPGHDPYEDCLRHYDRAPGGTLERMSHADMQTYMVELLMKQDQMSMAASIESRVPFLDHEFVEYAAAIPGKHKLQGWRTKAVLRAAVQDLLPEEILTRRKMGFPVPVGQWLRDRYAGLLDELVVGPRALDRGLFNAAMLRQLVTEHRSGTSDHGDRLWLLMNLEMWQRLFLEGEAPEAVLGDSLQEAALSAAA